jgi:hypothetical protein
MLAANPALSAETLCYTRASSDWVLVVLERDCLKVADVAIARSHEP